MSVLVVKRAGFQFPDAGEAAFMQATCKYVSVLDFSQSLGHREQLTIDDQGVPIELGPQKGCLGRDRDRTVAIRTGPSFALKSAMGRRRTSPNVCNFRRDEIQGPYCSILRLIIRSTVASFAAASSLFICTSCMSRWSRTSGVSIVRGCRMITSTRGNAWLAERPPRL